MAIVSDLAIFASTSFDYIIAGGGTAGLTLAARLTENPDIRYDLDLKHREIRAKAYRYAPYTAEP